MQMTNTHSDPTQGLTPSETPSRAKLWVGRVMTGLPLLFLTLDGVMKLVNVPEVIEASEKIGYHASTLPYLGAILLASVLLTAIPRTRVFGAVLLSAYLGGAVATHVRLGNPLFSHTLAPIYFAALVWGGLYLRDARVRALSPFAK